jgi:hypothetical protein
MSVYLTFPRGWVEIATQEEVQAPDYAARQEAQQRLLQRLNGRSPEAAS